VNVGHAIQVEGAFFRPMSQSAFLVSIVFP
jgi:hypothetical protein